MGKKILAIDDENDALLILKTTLTGEGYNVLTATNGMDGIAIARDEKPDLIILDLLMPEETGTGLYRKLHNKKKYRDIPVIVISGLAGSYLAVSKSVPVIEKPPDEELVLWEVAKALGEFV